MKFLLILFLIISNAFAVEFGERLDTIPEYAIVDSTENIKTYIYLPELYPDTSIKACFYSTKDGIYYHYSVHGTGEVFFNMFRRVLHKENGEPSLNISNQFGDSVLMWVLDDITYALYYFKNRNHFKFEKFIN